MALNFSAFKKRPFLWGGIAIAIFVLFYLLFSRGGGNASSGSTQYVETGPSEAEIAAQSNIAMAQIQANIASQQFASEAAIKNAEFAASVKNSEFAYNVALVQIDAEKAILENQSEYSLATARVAAETNLEMAKLDRDVLTTQLNTQSQMFSKQIDSLTNQALIAQVSTLKKKNRDDVLLALANKQ